MNGYTDRCILAAVLNCRSLVSITVSVFYGLFSSSSSILTSLWVYWY